MNRYFQVVGIPCLAVAMTLFLNGEVFPLKRSVAQETVEEAQQAKGKDPNVLFQWTAQQEHADSQWEFKDAEAWKFVEEDGNRILTQFQKPSSYKPPHRSPTHMALLKEMSFGSFQLDVELKSTHEDYGHRDVCLYFGFQNPGKFYYVHMAKAADPHANQIFIVNESDRTKISEKTTDGTPWDDQWHHVRIKRNVEAGTIAVYFDDMEKPIMQATDTHFKAGRIGFGSFDDTAAFRKLTVTELK